MTDEKKEMNALARFKREVEREVNNASLDACIEKLVIDTKDALVRAANQFNMLRQTLAECNGALSILSGIVRENSDVMKSLRGVSAAKFVEDSLNDVDINYVDDDSSFDNIISNIMNIKYPISRIKSCKDVADNIRDSIAAWNNKIVKMESRGADDGSSDAEREICKVKSESMKLHLASLEKRLDTVRSIARVANDSTQRFLNKNMSSI